MTRCQDAAAGPQAWLKKRASLGSLPAPSFMLVSSNCGRCSLSASTAISGSVTWRRPAFVFAALTGRRELWSPRRFAHLDHGAIQVNVPFPNGQNLPQAQCRFVSARMAGVYRREPRSLSSKAGHIANDDHFGFGDLGRFAELADIPGD